MRSCPRCGFDLGGGEGTPRPSPRPEPAQGEEQGGRSALARYAYLKVEYYAKLAGKSEEAARSELRRVEAAGQATRRDTLVGPVYLLTPRGAEGLAVEAPRNHAERGVLEKLAIPGFLSEHAPERKLLMPKELEEAGSIFRARGLDLLLPDPGRYRFHFDMNGRLSLLLTDLQARNADLERFALRLVDKEKHLSELSSGWEKLIQGGGFSITLLSAFERGADLPRLARERGLKSELLCFQVPILRAARGEAASSG